MKLTPPLINKMDGYLYLSKHTIQHTDKMGNEPQLMP